MQYTVNSSNDSGAGSLREAIALANENAGLDTIVIEADEVRLNSKIQISDSVEIKGNDAVITQTGQENIFVIDDSDDDSQLSVSFSDLTLTGAKSQSEGGAIATWEDLSLDRVTVKDNHSVASGGGVYAYGSTLVINNSIFEGNKVSVDAQSLNEGGAIYVKGKSYVTIDSSIFTKNEARTSAIHLDTVELNASNLEITDNTGRGILAFNSLMHLDNALVSGNNRSGIAFGIATELVLSSSTISNNSGKFGAGLAVESSGKATITDSIIEGNSATNAGGGLNVAIASDAEIFNSRISGNSAPIGSGIQTFDGGKVTLTDTYVTNNTGGEQLEGDIEYDGSNVDNPYGQEPTADIGYSSFLEQPTVEEPVTEQPTVEEPVTEEPTVEEPVTEQPTVEEPVTEQPTVEEPVTEPPTVEEPVTEEPVTEEPTVEEPTVDSLNIDSTEVHRFYQYEKGFHFYTADANESNVIQQETAAGRLSYDYEGESYRALASNLDTLTGEVIEEAEEVYRFFNSDTGAHLFTMFEAEKEYIETTLDNYSYEGVAYYAYSSQQKSIDTIPVYRMLNSDTGTHLFTADSNEISHIQNNLSNFTLEGDSGVAFYVMEI